MPSVHVRLAALALSVATALASGCASSPADRSLAWWAERPPLPDVDVSRAPDGIVPVPAEAHRALRRVFAKYTRLVAPSGRPIHFLAQAGVDDAQLVRARELMRFLLTDVPGTRFGSDKAEVANAMADRMATMVLFESELDAYRAQTGELPELPLFYQDLYAGECLVEGTEAYLSNERRDATLEVVFRLVYAAGIRWVQPEYAEEIRAAAHDAVRGGRWEVGLDAVLEGALGLHYLTRVIDVYYGIWAHDPHGTGRAFGGEYVTIDRAGQREHDPRGVELVEAFLPPMFEFDCRVTPEFDEVFVLEPSGSGGYTGKSRYLRRVRLTGDGDAGILAGDVDHELAGNAGDNWIDGGGGHDAVRFAGAQSEYVLDRSRDGVTVSDSVAGRDGTDELFDVECLWFADGRLPLVPTCVHPEPVVFGERAVAPDPNRPWPEYEFDLDEHVDGVATELLDLYDRNADDRWARSEAPAALRRLAEVADVDGEGGADRRELAAALRALLAGELELEVDPLREVERFLIRYDRDGDGEVSRGELPGALLEGFDRTDVDGSGGLSVEELLPAFVGGE